MTALSAPDAIRQNIWDLPPVHLDFAHAAIYPGMLSWNETKETLLRAEGIVKSSLRTIQDNLSKTALEGQLARQVLLLTGRPVEDWHTRNAGAQARYAALIEVVAAKLATINAHDGPVFAVQFLVCSMTASYTRQVA